MFQQFPFRICKKYVCDCCLTEEDAVDNLITEHLDRIRAHSAYEGKVILLGIAEVGKSTFLKQMKLMHQNGFKIDEKIRLIPIINQQIIRIIKCICRAMTTLNIRFENSENEENVSLLNSINDDHSMSSLSTKIVNAIKNIWFDKGIQQCYYRRREYWLTDSAKYFLDSIERISNKDYIPSNDDILRVRIPTTGIVQENFQLSEYTVQIVDVGGQKTERRKWIHCFDNVTTVIFLASLIEYDQYSADDPSKLNLMEESLALFNVILSCNYFAHASVILFLNKADLFAERLANSPLKYQYSEFDGADDDIEAAKEFIKMKYVNVASNLGQTRRVYPHFTISVDSKNIKIIFKEVKKRIFEDIINRFDPYY